MPELVRMKALRSWRNLEYEGDVESGQIFETPDYRARQLELSELAVRVTVLPVAGGQNGNPLEFVRKEPGRPLSSTASGGGGELSSSSHLDRARLAKTSPKHEAGRSSSPSTNPGG